MKCEIVQEQMMDGVTGTLGARRMAESYAHLRQCTSCRERWEALQRVESLLGHAQLCAPAPGFSVRLQKRLAHRRSTRWSPLAIFFIAFSTLLVTGLVFLPSNGIFQWVWYQAQDPRSLAWLQDVLDQLVITGRVMTHLAGTVMFMLFRHGWWLPILGYGLLAGLIIAAWMGLYSLTKVRRAVMHRA
ncbi:MAG: zf-HC2 domain-containing protein [Chloroflexi bacterium]|nr:zf-HC2 domain-containing protein [Chloroflexota bacterium]